VSKPLGGPPKLSTSAAQQTTRRPIAGRHSLGPEFPRGGGQNSPVTREGGQAQRRSSRFKSFHRIENRLIETRSVKPRDTRPSTRHCCRTVEYDESTRLHRRRGGENRWRGASSSVGVKPPGKVSVKTIPSLPGYRSSPPDSGVVPFSEGRCHQLRVEASPLAASNRRSKTAIAFIVP